MSTAAISYRSLKDASSEAKSVAKKLDQYADNLNSCVYKKLNQYNGSYSGNIQTAKSNVQKKMDSLRTKSRAYSNYASDLNDLKGKCENTDRSVRTLVSRLTATFKQNNGIRNSKVVNTINYYLTSWGNSSSAGRWIGGAIDRGSAIKDYIKQRMKAWWSYEGLEQLIKGLAEAALDIAIAACTIMLVTFSGGVWAVIVGVAALIGAAIVIYNSGVNIANEFRAYHETHNNNDPALGRRRSGEDTLQDTIRRESDSQGWHNVAAGMDGVVLACDVIGIADGIKKMGKNGLKFLKEKNMFKDGFFKNIGKSISSGINNIKCSWKMKDFSKVKDFASRLKSNFIYNFSKNLKNFDTTKDTIKTVKNCLGITKTFVSDGVNMGSTKKVILEKVVLPCTTVFTVNKDDPKVIGFLGNQMQIDFLDHTTAKDFYSVPKDIKSKVFGSDLFSNSIIDAKVLEKLGQSSNISISVPEIHVPEFNLKIA